MGEADSSGERIAPVTLELRYPSYDAAYAVFTAIREVRACPVRLGAIGGGSGASNWTAYLARVSVKDAVEDGHHTDLTERKDAEREWAYAQHDAVIRAFLLSSKKTAEGIQGGADQLESSGTAQFFDTIGDDVLDKFLEYDVLGCDTFK